MKLSILLTVMFALNQFAFANKTNQTTAEIYFKDSKIEHHYKLTVDEKESFTLVFKEKGKAAKSKKLSKSTAIQIGSQANRILWQSEFRKPAKTESCTNFIKIISNDQKTNVCAENRKAAGMSYGFLNSLSRYF